MKLNRTWAPIATTWALLLAGCSAAPSTQDEAISQPGGFEEPERRLAGNATEDYCGAEVLRWRYDEQTASLKLANSRLLLSCCGQRAMHVERVDSVYEVTERDEPAEDTGRCASRCAFDFSVSVHDVPRGEAYVKLLRDVTDEQSGPALIWSGAVDLARGSGSVVLESPDAEPASCTEHPAPRRYRRIVASK